MRLITVIKLGNIKTLIIQTREMGTKKKKYMKQGKENKNPLMFYLVNETNWRALEGKKYV